MLQIQTGGTFCFEFCTDLFDTLFLLFFYGYLNIADLQILAVTRFIEETAAEYAREQYTALDKPSSRPHFRPHSRPDSRPGSGNDDGFKLQLGAAGDSSMIGWINIDIMGGRAIRTIDNVQPLEVKKKYSTSIIIQYIIISFLIDFLTLF